MRGDVIFRLWPPRVQAGIEFTLYFLFFFPGVLALIYAGIDYASESWSYMPFGPRGPRGEVSINSPIGVPVSPLKSILPLAAFLLLLQGMAEAIRCVMCMRTGAWPQRLHDVEELDVTLRRQHEREAQMAAKLGGATGGESQ